MRSLLVGPVCLAVLVAIASQAWPQDIHGGHAAPPEATASSTPVIQEFQEANDRMHRDMSLQFTGDADRDFAQAMIPHHQGAIDMARIVLEHGDDPELRNLAQGVIDTQEREINQLRDWLSRNPSD